MKACRGSELLFFAVLVGVVLRPLWADESKPADGNPPSAFAVRLLDDSGEPVAGAEVGLIAGWGDMNLVKTGWEYLSGARLKDVNVKSGTDGIVRFAGNREMLDRFCLV